MSLEMLSAVWDMELPRNEQAVIEVFAWHANADGVCWPSKARIMYRTGFSEPTVKRALRSLKDKELLTVEDHATGGRGRTPIYKLHPEKGVKKISFEEWKARLAKGGAGEPLSGDKGGQPRPERGSNGAEKGVTAATPEPTRNRQPEPSDSGEHPNGSSPAGRRGGDTADGGPPEQEPEEAKPLSYRAYAFRRFRELIKEAKDAGRDPDPLPDSRLGEYAAFYEQHAKEGADPDDLDDAIRWLVAKASGEVEDEAQAWAYFGTAVRAVRNGGVRKPFSVIEGGKGVGDGADRPDASGYTAGYEFLFERG